MPCAEQDWGAPFFAQRRVGDGKSGGASRTVLQVGLYLPTFAVGCNETEGSSMKMNTTFLILLFACVAAIAVSGCGLGVVQVTNYPNAVIGTSGQIILMDDLLEILTDNIPDDEKRNQFRELGIEDPDLIEALLTMVNPL